MRLNLADGQVEVVNAGHPAPWRVRAGRASQLELEAQLPAGMFQATAYRAQSIRLQPADRLVLVTDGVLEAGAPGPVFDEQSVAGLLLATAGLTPPQCVAEVLRDAAVLRPADARRRDSDLPLTGTDPPPSRPGAGIHDSAAPGAHLQRSRHTCLNALTKCPGMGHRRAGRSRSDHGRARSVLPGDAGGVVQAMAAMTGLVKDELSQLPAGRTCCRRAEISALLRFAGGLYLIDGRVVVQAELESGLVARRLRRSGRQGRQAGAGVAAGGGLGRRL